MKTLLILRHAKSSWDNPNWADFERPLNLRGLQSAPLMGEVLQKQELNPQIIISSPAERAKQTAVLTKEAAQINTEITYVEEIYEASPRTLLNIVAQIADENEMVLVVGHNPGLEGFIKILTGETCALPTAALVKIDLKIDSWQELTSDCGKVDLFIRPKDALKSLTAE